MKIISTILIAILAVPFCLNTSENLLADGKEFIPNSYHTFVAGISYGLNSEPAIMIRIGTAMVAVAGFGRKRILKKNKRGMKTDE